jgi:hypothetical protein
MATAINASSPVKRGASPVAGDAFVATGVASPAASVAPLVTSVASPATGATTLAAGVAPLATGVASPTASVVPLATSATSPATGVAPLAAGDAPLLAEKRPFLPKAAFSGQFGGRPAKPAGFLPKAVAAGALVATTYDVQVLTWKLKLRGNKKFHIEVGYGKNVKIHRYSEQALKQLQNILPEEKAKSDFLKKISCEYVQAHKKGVGRN